MGTHATECNKVRGQFAGSCSLFSPWDGTQVIRFGGKHLYPLAILLALNSISNCLLLDKNLETLLGSQTSSRNFSLVSLRVPLLDEAWCLTSLTSALRRPRQDYHEFQATLRYRTETPSWQNTTNKTLSVRPSTRCPCTYEVMIPTSTCNKQQGQSSSFYVIFDQFLKKGNVLGPTNHRNVSQSV